MGFTKEQMKDAVVQKGAGCTNCNGSGYKGRIALYEVMRFTDELKEMVLQGASSAELKVAAARLGMNTLRMSGITKILDGVTTPEEVLRVTMSD
jgi:type IV pilus assembly protein PilB